jgi:hypothetical protein
MEDFWKNGLDWNQQLWRYHTSEKLTRVLNESQLYFAFPVQFEDVFEGCTAVTAPDLPADERYQEMDHTEQAFYRLRHHFKISCWHRADFESDAMWKLYAGEKKGVAICSTPERMRASIRPFRLPQASVDERIWAGDVSYQDFLKSPRLGLDLLNQFFHKHQAFAWEREFRLLIPHKDASQWVPGLPDKGVAVEVDLHALVERIVLESFTHPCRT